MLHGILILLSLLTLPGQIDTRVGSAASDSPTASLFGAGGEVYGNIIPCVTEPNGMTFWTPQTRITEKKGAAPYYYSDAEFMGFRASHWMSGSAVQDFGSFYIIPGGKTAPLDHSQETASPAYYRLGDHEMTARSHSAIFRLDCDCITFGVNNGYSEGSVSVDAERGIITAGNPVHRIYQGWGKHAGFSGWACLKFNRPVSRIDTLDFRTLSISFEPGEGPLLVKMGCSFTDAAAAEANLESEIPHWDFERVRTELEAIWARRLSIIEVEGEGPMQEHFYGSMWRSALFPSTVSDCGSKEQDFDNFSLWDTFRALHPLLTLLTPTQDGRMMQALVRKYERGGWLPIFPMWGSYTSAMIGDHATSVITDAYTKGIRNFDVRSAYRAMRRNAFETPADTLEYQDGKGRRALESYLRYGYIPKEDGVPYVFHKNEQASRTLEYAYDDWCVSRMALKTWHLRDWWRLRRRARNWRNVFDPRTGYPQERLADGSFVDEPENYLKKTSFITEGTPCHYSWFVPHDVRGLVRMLGREEFEARLDSMFVERRYWHGNEPCHQVAYLYDYIGRPEKAQAVLKDILHSEYRNTPGGLSGNDDAGQMSAWYIFSSLGFYQVCPGSGEYALGQCSFPSAVIHLENGRDFTIINRGTGSGRYTLNGRRLRRPFLRHRDILRGGTLVIE